MVLSFVIAIFASYTALDLVNSISVSKGKSKWIWLIGSSLAMGVGIWSMHFIGMLAFQLPGVDIYYDVPLLVLSILVAVLASALALYIVSTREASVTAYLTGGTVMGAAISGMHYIGIASMRLGAVISWNYNLVFLSILVAVIASYVALFAAFNLREDLTARGFILRGVGGVFLGLAIAGMHYTAMAAMSFTLVDGFIIPQNQILATDGVASFTIIATLVILGIALSGSNIDRALNRKTLLNEVLQQGIKSRDEFVSVASHELRTPLTSLKLQIDMVTKLLTKPDIDREKIVSLIEKTNQSMVRMNRLVEDMLDMSRASTGKLVLQKEYFDLTELVSEVLERFYPLLEKAECPVKFEQSEKIIGCWDKFRIEQVLVNLISNAAKYAPGKLITIRVSQHKNCAIVSIKDEGKGIAKEDQERIFQRFERGQGQQFKSGLGLGLYIVKEILVKHEGDIKLESKINEGAEFVVRLPLA